MIAILFSKAAICYYLLGVFCQYHSVFGKILRQEAGTGNIYNTLFNIETICGLAFLIYYSYKVAWWAFIGLFLINIITYVIVDQLTNRTKAPGDTRARLANIGLWSGPLLIIGMFYFVLKG